MNTLFEAHDLQKVYASRIALNLPFFRMERGEVVALTGYNGCGKSPLLRLLAFLEKPSSGSLRYFGDISDPRREITLLLQSPYLVKESVFRNVTLGLRLRGRRDGLARAYADAMQAVGFTQPDILAARRRMPFPEENASGWLWQRALPSSPPCFCWMNPHPMWMQPARMPSLRRFAAA